MPAARGNEPEHQESLSGCDEARTGMPFPEFDLPDLQSRRWCRADLLGHSTVLFCFSSW